jgi:hypothetical protein
MDEDDEDEEDGEGSPEEGNNGNINGGQGGNIMSTDDYEEIDYKICGELGISSSESNFIIEEKNRALDEFAQTQNPEGAI